jgi:hypothetical protein
MWEGMQELSRIHAGCQFALQPTVDPCVRARCRRGARVEDSSLAIHVVWRSARL